MNDIDQDWLDELRADDREARLQEEPAYHSNRDPEGETEYNRTRGNL